jgi:hypothetical protein
MLVSCLEASSTLAVLEWPGRDHRARLDSDRLVRRASKEKARPALVDYFLSGPFLLCVYFSVKQRIGVVHFLFLGYIFSFLYFFFSLLVHDFIFWIERHLKENQGNILACLCSDKHMFYWRGKNQHMGCKKETGAFG